MGWDVIFDILGQTEKRAVVTVDMNDTSLVPGNILDYLKARNVIVVFDMGSGIAWSVDGQSVTAEKADAIDFSVTIGTDSIPADIVGSVANGHHHIQISLAHEGTFECTPILSVNLGKENAGRTASLYYYNQVPGKLEPVSEAEITEDGTANLAFRHASDYLIVVKPTESIVDTPPRIPIDSAPSQTPPGSTDTAPPQSPADSTDTSSHAPEAPVVLSPGTGEDTQASWPGMAIGVLALILSAGLAARWRKKA